MPSNPLDDFETLLEQIEDGLSFPQAGRLSIDLLEHDEKYVLKADLPGYDAEDIDVTFSDGQLTIVGRRSDTSDVTTDQYVRRERRYQSVNRTVQLPGPVDEAGIEASHTNGVLTVHLPKTDPDTGREIEIN